MKLIKIILIIVIGLISIKSYSKDLIPGFFETDVNYARLYNFYEEEIPKIGFSELKFKYGAEWKYFNPYIFGGWKTFFKLDKDEFKKNYPYRDIYNWGAGFKISIFYFEYEHRCSHEVFTSGSSSIRNITIWEQNYLLYDYMPTLSYDSFKVGIKVRVD